MSDLLELDGAEIEKLALAEDDFGHELRVGRLFVGLNHEHGGTYTDPITS